jgi:glutathione peroxidase
MTPYDIAVTALDGRATTLGEYRGKVLLIVNVASKCGFSGQYAGLEDLHERYAAAGLVVLGFPCNQFAGQEPGDAAAIAQFCSLSYGVSFPMFAKVNVNGADAHPLYQYLKEAAPGTLGTRAIKWNFTKFLVDRTGETVTRYGTATPPSRLESAIQTLLGTAVAA